MSPTPYAPPPANSGVKTAIVAGALVALPVVAVIRETTAYLRRHMVLEPWGTPAPAGASPPPTPQPPSGPPEPAGSADRVRPPVSEHAADDPDGNSDDPDELTEAGVPIPGYGVTPE